MDSNDEMEDDEDEDEESDEEPEPEPVKPGGWVGAALQAAANGYR